MDKNISTLLKEIKAETGWSEPRLSKELGTSQPTVNRILNGQTECRSSTYRAIQELHKRVCIAAVAKANGGPHRRSVDDRRKAERRTLDRRAREGN